MRVKGDHRRGEHRRFDKEARQMNQPVFSAHDVTKVYRSDGPSVATNNL
jgi:hypothetical protein